MPIGVIVLIVICILIGDVIIRFVTAKIKEARTRREREKALDIGLKMEINPEAKSLKSVRVDSPNAKILAVDDEAIILDSFRKILVLEGYSVDTVETGPEALGLIQKKDYDFVFTDLKMPGMDGVELTKAVKHLRPDIDVVLITGYATIESAVEVMKFGAMDYVQKPFTEDELVEFVKKLVFKRQDRLNMYIKPTVHLVKSSGAGSDSKSEFNVPAGVFVSEGHTWASVQINGMVRVGIDDFAQKIISQIDAIELPRKGQKVKKGDRLFTIVQGERSFDLPSPITGKVEEVNLKLADQIELIKKMPYEIGWVCSIEPERLSQEITGLKIGEDAATWYQKEVDRYSEMTKGKEINDEFWEKFIAAFLKIAS